jgi:hypothetical protein
MATVISTLGVKMDLDTSGFNTKMDEVGKKLEGVGQRLRDIGTTLTTNVTAPIVAGFGAAVWAASDLNETINKTNVVFDDAAAGVIAWSEDSATAFGLSQNEALGFASTFGNIFTSMGMSGEAAADMSQDIVQLGADLGSFNNIPTGEALDAIRAGLLGEYEPLKRFGIVLSEAEVEARALEMGLVDANGEVTEAGKVAARQALITEKSANAQGDFANTSGSLANQMKILKARLTDAAASIGQVLLPYVTRLVTFLGGLIERFQGLSDRMRKIIVIVGLVAASVGPLLLVVGTLAPIIGRAIAVGGKFIKFLKVLRVTMLTSMWPILAVVAALAILYLIWSKDLFGIKTKILKWFDVFKAPGGGLDKLKEKFVAIKDVLSKFFSAALQKAGQLLRKFFEMAKGPAIAAFGLLVTVFKTVASAVGTVVGGIASRLDPLRSAFDGVVQMVTGLIGIFTNLFQGDLRGALDSAISMFEGWLQYLNGIGGFILSILSGALGAIWDAIAGVDWVGLGVALLGYIETAIGQLIDLAGKLAVKAEEMIGGFVDWVTTYDWVALGVTILGYIDTAVAAITGLAGKMATKAGEFLGGFVDWFTTYDWAGLGTTILGYIELAAGYIFLPLVLYKHGGDLIDGLKSGIEYTWNLLKIYIGGIAGRILSAVGDFLTTLYEKGKDIIQGLYDGVVGFWDNTLKPWLAAIGSAVWEALKYIVFPLLLYYYGEDIIDGMLAGIEAAWVFLKNWFTLIKTKITGFFSKAAEWLLEKGKDVLGGLRDGIYAIWYATGGIWDWFYGIGGKITGAIGDLTTTLKQAGRDILQGLWDGMTEKWGAVSGWVGGLGGEIANLKGPLEVDRVLLTPGGTEIMRGLLKGMKQAYPAVEQFLAGVTADIAGMAFSAPSVNGASNLSGNAAAGPITINVSGAGDPARVADEVYRLFSRELGLRGAI